MKKIFLEGYILAYGVFDDYYGGFHCQCTTD